MEELKKMNKLKSNYLKTGQKLIVGYIYVAPPKPATPSDTTSTAVNTPQIATMKNAPFPQA